MHTVSERHLKCLALTNAIFTHNFAMSDQESLCEDYTINKKLAIMTAKKLTLLKLLPYKV